MAQELIKSDYQVMIFTIRGKKVMVDNDLALLYDIPMKALKQQVKRNHIRFPADFMFELSTREKGELVTNCDRLELEMLKNPQSEQCEIIFHRIDRVKFTKV